MKLRAAARDRRKIVDARIVVVSVVAGLVSFIGGYGPASTAASHPAASVSVSAMPAAATWQAPATPEDLARDFLRKNPKIVDSEESIKALEELYERIAGASKVKQVAAQAQLDEIRRQANRPDVVRVYLPPDSDGSVGRRPDVVPEVRRPDGSTRLVRREVKTITGQRSSGGNPPGPPSAHKIKQAVKSGITEKTKVGPGGKDRIQRPQLTEALKVAGRQVQPDGTMVIVVPDADPATDAAVERAMQELGEEGKLDAQQRAALESVDVWSIGGSHVGTWKRTPNGTYARAARACPKLPDAGPGMSAPSRLVSGPCGEEDESSQAPAPPTLGGLAPSGLRGSLMEAQKLGGIDFTSMELRYLSVDETDEGSQLSSAYRIPDTAGASSGSVVDGLRGAMQASDAFFVWLSLPPSTFWVNLNPDQPNRIVDDALGRTEVGRVLLEADRRLKQIDTELVNPHTDLGARFWNHQQPAPDGSYCFTYRLWIVPGTAKVRETDEAIYIVDAPLEVNMRPTEIVNGGCGKQPAAVKQHNAALYRRLILPHVIRAVNHAPEYEALRRVYLSRIAAEWYRQHSTTEPSAYSDLIDSGNIDRWRLKGSWTPRQTYQGFVRDWSNGKFDYRIRERHGNVVTIRTYRTGGVDFTSLLKQDLTADAFASLAPGLESTVDKGLEQATVDPHTRDRWLGGTLEETASSDPTVPADDSTSASATPDDPWSRDYAPILVPLMILVGVGLVAVAALRERRRQYGTRSSR